MSIVSKNAVQPKLDVGFNKKRLPKKRLPKINDGVVKTWLHQQIAKPGAHAMQARAIMVRILIHIYGDHHARLAGSRRESALQRNA